MTTFNRPSQHRQPHHVLVAGGAGFLGAHLCRRLLEQGDTVICLDNLTTGSLEQIGPCMDSARFFMVEHDVIHPIALDIPISRIYNLACPASPRHYQQDRPHTLLTCIYGARNLLELAREKNARILLASTSEVYGNPSEHPQHESYRGNVNIVGLRSCYDEGKRGAETLFSDYRAHYGFDTKIARIFNTYGPGMAVGDGRLISNLVVQAIKGEPLTIYGDGSQTRSLCYVDDMIEGLMLLMDSPASFQGPVNLGNPVESTVLEIAKYIRKLTGTPSPLVYQRLPADDPVRRCPEIVLAQNHLGWWPRTPLSAGLQLTINDFSRRLSTLPAAQTS